MNSGNLSKEVCALTVSLNAHYETAGSAILGRRPKERFSLGTHDAGFILRAMGCRSS